MSFQYVPLGGGSAKDTWINQRATVRYRCAPATTSRVLVSDDHEYQRAWVLDLSVTGAGLSLPKALNAGTFVAIQLRSTTTKKTYELPAYVVHATVLANGDWLVGCEFVQALSKEELDDLL